MSFGHQAGLSIHHHSSHRHLLTVESAEDAPHAHVDAVIVPAARPVGFLDAARDLARALGSVFVVLCSKDVSADDVLTSAPEGDVSTVALDVDAITTLPRFETSAAVEGTRFARLADQGRKRNLGLLLSRLAGWRRIMFLDDDIDCADPGDVRAAAGLLGRYDVVGFQNGGFSDNSVVCRAGARLKLPQSEFIGAGALVVAPHRMTTFFPDIYNEDWFFFLGASRMAVTGSVWHRSFSGAMAASRAREEEFGDCLGEGMFWALDVGASPADVDLAHWKNFLAHRLRFIEGLEAINNNGPRMIEVTAALEAAYGQTTAIADEPELCDGYLDLWRYDLRTWRRLNDHLGPGHGLTKALAKLGWNGIARLRLLPWHE